MYKWQISLAIASLTSLALIIYARNYQAVGKVVPSSIEKTMQNTPPSQVKVSPSLNLQIWQNDPKRPLSGAYKVGSQLGFATIDFLLENTTEKPITIQLEKIEVRRLNSKSNQPLMSLPAKSITLGGLEYAPQRYQLSNRDGYQSGQVEAIVVYKLDGKQYILRSAPVSAR
ncbi:hypothetical protein NIES2101_34955 [Calothrix sp. HK-06]|nr:hypothetical protein NIES2101_34955 [Calothrix sp. HK-06]